MLYILFGEMLNSDKYHVFDLLNGKKLGCLCLSRQIVFLKM